MSASPLGAGVGAPQLPEQLRARAITMSATAFDAMEQHLARFKEAEATVEKVATATGYRKAHVVVACLLVAVYWILRNFGVTFFSHVLILSPVLKSFDALKSRGGDDDTQWLCYWVMVAVFTLAECIAEAFTQQSSFVIWLLYFAWKNAFFYWLGIPENIGKFQDFIVDPLVLSIKKVGETEEQ